jgi:hypothetical protein
LGEVVTIGEALVVLKKATSARAELYIEAPANVEIRRNNAKKEKRITK